MTDNAIVEIEDAAAKMAQMAGTHYNEEGPLPAAQFFLFTYTPDDGVQVEVIFAPTEDDAQKAALAEIIRDRAKQLGAIAVMVICEIWLSIRSAGDLKMPYVQPCEDPERTEAMQVMLETYPCVRVGFMKITRDEAGKRTCEPFPGWEDDIRVAGGRMCNFLPPRD